VIGYLVRRVVHGGLVLLVVALLIYGIEPALRPENYPGQSYFPLVWHDVQRALLHLDFGHACQWPGCPSIHTLWMRGIAGDLWMLAGGLVFGIVGGVSLGTWCARRPGTASARFVESMASLLFCAPVYVVGLGLLLLFNRDIGVWPVHGFFDALPAGFVSPTKNPWDWLRAYLVPWLVVAAPLAAACLRLTARLTVDELQSDYVRTAIAKGLPYGYVIRHHAARGAYPSVTSLVWSYVPLFVTNVVFVEWVWNVPGFWFATRRALDQDPNFPGIDVPMLKAISLWTALIIVVLSVVADVFLAALDPRARAADRP
jgi:ABC-type dipeptide/oligopeptide/nickel transport system permease component